MLSSVTNVKFGKGQGREWYPQYPQLTTARTAGPPPLCSVVAARQTGVEWGGRTPDVWEVAMDFFRYDGIV